jgi:hypothetical protein
MSPPDAPLYPLPRLKRGCRCGHRWDVKLETEVFVCPRCGAFGGCQFHTDEERELHYAGHREDHSWWTAGT